MWDEERRKVSDFDFLNSELYESHLYVQYVRSFIYSKYSTLSIWIFEDLCTDTRHLTSLEKCDIASLWIVTKCKREAEFCENSLGKVILDFILFYFTNEQNIIYDKNSNDDRKKTVKKRIALFPPQITILIKKLTILILFIIVISDFFFLHKIW